MKRRDWRIRPQERSLEPPDDNLDEEEYNLRESARQRVIERLIDESRELGGE